MTSEPKVCSCCTRGAQAALRNHGCAVIFALIPYPDKQKRPNQISPSKWKGWILRGYKLKHKLQHKLIRPAFLNSCLCTAAYTHAYELVKLYSIFAIQKILWKHKNLCGAPIYHSTKWQNSRFEANFAKAHFCRNYWAPRWHTFQFMQPAHHKWAKK